MPVFAIDASSANKPERTGVEEYCFQIIQALKGFPLQPGEHVVLLSPTPLGPELGQLPLGWESRVLNWPPGQGWMMVRVTGYLLRHTPSLLFVPGQGLPLATTSKIVATIHDIGFRRRPDLYDPIVCQTLEDKTADIVRRADKIFTVSAFSKREIMDAYHVPDERLIVTPNAVVPRLPPLDKEGLRGGSVSFVFVGRLEKKKNIVTLVRAFTHFIARNPSFDGAMLHLIGQKGFGFDEIEREIAASPVRDQIRIHGYLSQNERDRLLGQATALVFPSWYEGFGMPILEAFVQGVPVIASDILVHREVGANAAVYVRPQDEEGLAQAMLRVCTDQDLASTLVRNGSERLSHYSWKKSAETILETMRSVCKVS